MSYYGDAYYAGDPGLFSFVKKIKLGRALGGIVKALPGANGVLTAVNAIRQAAGSTVAARPVTPTAPPIVQVPQAPLPNTVQQPITLQGAVRARGRRRTRTTSAFALRMAAARRARLRSRGYAV